MFDRVVVGFVGDMVGRIKLVMLVNVVDVIVLFVLIGKSFSFDFVVLIILLFVFIVNVLLCV